MNKLWNVSNSSIERKITILVLYILVFGGFIINDFGYEILSWLLLAFALIIGGVLGYICKTLAFLPIISESMEIRSYKSDEATISVIVSFVNLFFVFMGIALLVASILSYFGL